MDAGEDRAERWLPLVTSIASRFARFPAEREELIQCGTLGLMNALARCRENSEAAFPSFAFKFIEGEIRKHIRTNRLITVPRRTLAKAAKLKRLLDDAEKLTGESMRLSEAAEALGIAENELGELLFVIEQGEAYEPISTFEITSSEEDFAETLIERTTLQGCIGRLPPLEREVIRSRFWDGETQKSIAERLGVSQSAVSKAEARALSFLRKTSGVQYDPE